MVTTDSLCVVVLSCPQLTQAPLYVLLERGLRQKGLGASLSVESAGDLQAVNLHFVNLCLFIVVCTVFVNWVCFRCKLHLPRA